MSDFHKMLEQLGVISCDRLELYHDRVRDREDVSVFRDPVTKVIVLSKASHISDQYYAERDEEDGYIVRDQKIISPRVSDNLRRKSDFLNYVQGKRWLDFGCGLGGTLEELSDQSASCAGLEVNKLRAEFVASKGYQVFNSIGELSHGSFDIITLFHVLEHLSEPVEALTDLKAKLAAGGKVLIEVPHAKDALFDLYDCTEFKNFTFWSEHLVLHTRESLRAVAQAAGFKNIQIKSLQRYPLSNHLYWLSQGLPGGHKVWPELSSNELDRAYQAALAMLDQTDTLLLIAS
ncbi:MULTISPECIES: class I SAM-dependent methyltransferase [unclassified Roseobacter]|uniref:class I SAM-dependent methyltransferase n=1 Tax=unclassified Roseobacter TaxID=196798 RepID=UPI0030EB9169